MNGVFLEASISNSSNVSPPTPLLSAFHFPPALLTGEPGGESGGEGSLDVSGVDFKNFASSFKGRTLLDIPRRSSGVEV